MPAIQDPNFGLYYGYTVGEDGWGAQMSTNLQKLGALIHLGVISSGQSAPPGTPAEGDRYLVAGPSATGSWTGQEGKIAVYVQSAWQFHSPAIGWTMYVEDEGVQQVFTASGWITASGEQPYDLHCTYNGRMDNGITLLRVAFPRTTTFLAGLPSSQAKSEAAATASSVFTIYKISGGVPSSIGTITFAPAATSGTFAMASDQIFAEGDMMEVVAPAVSDATLADISLTIVGKR